MQKKSFNSCSVGTTWRDTGDFYSFDDDDEAVSSSSLSSIDSVSEFEVHGDIESSDNNYRSNDSPPYHQQNTTTPMIAISSPKSSSSSNGNHPPTPWDKSTAKIRIINELLDPTSYPLCKCKFQYISQNLCGQQIQARALQIQYEAIVDTSTQQN